MCLQIRRNRWNYAYLICGEANTKAKSSIRSSSSSPPVCPSQSNSPSLASAKDSSLSLGFFLSFYLLLLLHSIYLFVLFNCRIFSPDSACEVIEAERHSHVFYEAEPDIWIVMVRSLLPFLLFFFSFSNMCNCVAIF